jgi:glycosyltransferase involved in cell wall biosynthesis
MIGAITTCVNYDDYLAITLPGNRSFFRDYYIVTDKNPPPSLKELADNYNCKLIETDVFYEEGSPFNKSRAINKALELLDGSWVCHLDADIILQEKIKHHLNLNNLDTDTIYGVGRIMIPDINGYLYFKTNDKIHEDWLIQYTGARKKDSVVVSSDTIRRYIKKNPDETSSYIEFIPIGYFQLFYCQSTVRYPTLWKDAQGDVEFAMQFKNHIQLPYPCLHLPIVGGEDAHSIANWKGRTTPRFSIKENPEQA